MFQEHNFHDQNSYGRFQNVNAKVFVPNVNAAVFVPSFAAAPPPVPAQAPLQPLVPVVSVEAQPQILAPSDPVEPLTLAEVEAQLPEMECHTAEQEPQTPSTQPSISASVEGNYN